MLNPSSVSNMPDHGGNAAHRATPKDDGSKNSGTKDVGPKTPTNAKNGKNNTTQIELTPIESLLFFNMVRFNGVSSFQLKHQPPLTSPICTPIPKSLIGLQACRQTLATLWPLFPHIHVEILLWCFGKLTISLESVSNCLLRSYFPSIVFQNIPEHIPLSFVPGH